jgi:hypothetical protein
MAHYFDRTYFIKESLFMYETGRRAGRIEFFRRSDAETAQRYAERVFKFTALSPNSSRGIDLFYSNEREVLLDLIRLTRLVERGDVDAIRESGKILGYPDCCIDAYIKDRLYLSVNTGLNWLIRRVQHKGRFDLEMNPFESQIRHIPCSLNCRGTQKLIDINKRIWGIGDRKEKGLAFITPLPFSFIEDEGVCILDYIKIEITHRDGDRVYYKIISNCKRERVFASLIDVNNLVISGGNFLLYRDENLKGLLPLRFFLWSNEYLFSENFYKNLFLASITARVIGVHTGANFYVDERYTKIVPYVKGVIDTLLSKNTGVVLNGGITPVNNMILIPLVIDGSNINIILQFNEDTRRFFIRGRYISLSIQGTRHKIQDYVITFLRALLNQVEGTVSSDIKHYKRL